MFQILFIKLCKHKLTYRLGYHMLAKYGLVGSYELPYQEKAPEGENTYMIVARTTENAPRGMLFRTQKLFYNMNCLISSP